MGVRDEIFPTHPSEAYVQTEWSRGWGYAVIGFGYAAQMLTEQRARMHASVDQIGLAVFYLQRHRTELVIKHALVLLGVDPSKVARIGHDLQALWRELESVVRSGHGGWEHLADTYGEFVAVMHEADGGSFAYRYPIDKGGDESKRAPFIDLDALERHAEAFENGVGGYTDWVYELAHAGP